MTDRWSRQLLTQVAADGAAGLDERRLVEVAQGADVQSEVSGGRVIGRLHQQRTVDLWRGLSHRLGRSCNEHGAAGAMSDSRRDVQFGGGSARDNNAINVTGRTGAIGRGREVGRPSIGPAHRFMHNIQGGLAN